MADLLTRGTIRSIAVCAFSQLMFLSSALAHHSYAAFDQATTRTIIGTVREVQWTNPHVFIQLLVEEAPGKITEWSIEGNNPQVMKRFGWSRDALKPGDKAEITIHPLRNGANGGGLLFAKINGRTIGKMPNAKE